MVLGRFFWDSSLAGTLCNIRLVHMTYAYARIYALMYLYTHTLEYGWETSEEQKEKRRQQKLDIFLTDSWSSAGGIAVLNTHLESDRTQKDNNSAKSSFRPPNAKRPNQELCRNGL